METVRPHVRTIPVRCAPAKAPCPNCGKLGRRKATHNRRVRSLAYKQVVVLDVTYGEYPSGPVATMAVSNSNASNNRSLDPALGLVTQRGHQ